MPGEPPKNGPVHLVTVAWGQRFIDRFLTMTLPTLLAPGNIPYLAGARSVEYHVYTGPREGARLRQSPLMKSLEEIVPARIHHIDKLGAGDKYLQAVEFYIQALEAARREGAGTMMLPPDCIWADDVMRNVDARVNQGYRAIMADGLRVVGEDFMPRYLELAATSENGARAIMPGTLIALALKYVHSYEAAVTWTSSHIHDVPFRMHWPVRGLGVLSHGFCYNPIYLAPDKFEFGEVKALDHGLVDATISDPSRVYYCKDSDELALVGIDAEGYSGANFKPTGRREKILTAASWAMRDATPENLRAAHAPVRRRQNMGDEAVWRNAERIAGRLMRTVLNCCKLLMAMKIMRDTGLTLAPAMLAYALYRGRLTWWLHFEGPFTLFAPTDQALAELGRERLNELLSPENSPELLRLFKAHFRVGAIPEAEALTLLNGHSVVKGGIEVEDALLHLVDGLLTSPSAPG
jgi:uncharacterized surface protein with fasciclin (FAS1) repeats